MKDTTCRHCGCRADHYLCDDGHTHQTLHQYRLQLVRERHPAVQDGPYAYIHSDQHMV